MAFLEALILSPIVLTIVAIIYLGWLAYLVENKSAGLATFVLLGTLAALQFFTSFQPFTMIIENPLSAIGILAVYLLCGMAFTYVKWRSYVNRTMETISERTEERLSRVAVLTSSMDDTRYLHKDETVEQANARRRREAIDAAIESVIGSRTLPIQIQDHKARALSWMAYWPISSLYYLLDDPLRRMFEYCYRRMAGVLQAHSNKATQDFNDRFGR